MTDLSEVEIEFTFVDANVVDRASLTKLEQAVYSAVRDAPKGDDGGCLVESMIFTPEKCVALGLKADAIPSGRVWIGALRGGDDDGAPITTKKKIGVETMRTDPQAALLDGINLLADVEQRESHCTRQAALEKVTKRGGLGAVLYDLLASATAKGAAGAVAPDPVVIDTTVPAGADRESRRKAFNRKFDRRVAELMAGPEPLGRLDAETEALRDKALYDEYRSLATA